MIERGVDASCSENEDDPEEVAGEAEAAKTPAKNSSKAILEKLKNQVSIL
jgi:hypothetical protein